MSPYEFAKRECADYVNGACVWTMDGGCLLAQKPMKPCQRFEKGVMNLPDQPGADKNPAYFDYLGARDKYLEATARTARVVRFRPCPDCGNPLKKRQRVCSSCAKKRRRQAYRQSQAKRRKAVNI